MSDGELWQRYDAKVVQVRELEAEIDRLEGEVAAIRDERDRWARSCAVLTQKLTSARLIAERLRNAGRSAEPRALQSALTGALAESSQSPSALFHDAPSGAPRGAPRGAPQGPVQGVIETDPHRLRDEYDRAREALGLLFTALSGAWSAREQAWKATSESGGRLLYALTRGAMASVSLDNYKVDGDWLRRVDLEKLKIELGYDDGGIHLSVDDGVAVDLSEVQHAIDHDPFDADDPYSPSAALPPPPSFTSGQVEPALISALDPYDDPEHDLDPGRSARAPVGRMPSRSSTQKAIPVPTFRIGKLVKPTP